MDRVYIGNITLYSKAFSNTILYYNTNSKWFELKNDTQRIIRFKRFHPSPRYMVLYDYYRIILASHGIDL